MPPVRQSTSTHYDLALRLLRRCLTAAPESACLHARLGFCYAATGDPDAAETTLRRALDLDPADVVVRMLLGWLLALRGRDAEAQQQYRAVLALDADHDGARRRLVDLSRGRSVTVPPGADARWWGAQAERLQATGLLD